VSSDDVTRGWYNNYHQQWTSLNTTTCDTASNVNPISITVNPLTNSNILFPSKCRTSRLVHSRPRALVDIDKNYDNGPTETNVTSRCLYIVTSVTQEGPIQQKSCHPDSPFSYGPTSITYSPTLPDYSTGSSPMYIPAYAVDTTYPLLADNSQPQSQKSHFLELNHDNNPTNIVIYYLEKAAKSIISHTKNI
jgi:hypothetical protein